MRSLRRPTRIRKLLVALFALLAARAFAHPGPAIPPEFPPGNCITVLDKRETQQLPLAYTVPFDDDIFSSGDIVLPDAKTHQFFAFSGVVGTLVAGSYPLFPFDATLDGPLALPLWLDQDDVDRAAAAVSPADMTGFDASQVVADDLLAAHSEVARLVHALGDKTTRVPITQEQAQQGVLWDLRALVPGLYTIAGYVFSPPYNDWAPRAGVFKVIDGETNLPAATIEPVDTVLFAGRGRRVSGCVDAPSASTLSAWVRSEDLPDAPWENWIDREPLAAFATDGRFELCFMNASPERAGTLRVRLEITTPEGERSAAYSPDTMLAVKTQAKSCVENEETCCTGSAPRASTGDAASEPEPPASSPNAEYERSASCQVAAGESGGPFWFGLLLCLLASRRL